MQSRRKLPSYQAQRFAMLWGWFYESDASGDDQTIVNIKIATGGCDGGQSTSKSTAVAGDEVHCEMKSKDGSDGSGVAFPYDDEQQEHSLLNCWLRSNWLFCGVPLG